MSNILDTIQSPSDVKQLTLTQLEQLAQEIRERMIAVLAKTGGHLGPNLGVVELTLALHVSSIRQRTILSSTSVIRHTCINC